MSMWNKLRPWMLPVGAAVAGAALMVGLGALYARSGGT